MLYEDHGQGVGLFWFGFFKIFHIIHPTKKRNEQYSCTRWMTSKLPSILASLSFHDSLSSPLVSLVRKQVEGYFSFPLKCLTQYNFQWFSSYPGILTLYYAAVPTWEQIYISLINSSFNDFCWFPVFAVSLLRSLLSQAYGFPWFPPLLWCRLQVTPYIFEHKFFSLAEFINRFF